MIRPCLVTCTRTHHGVKEHDLIVTAVRAAQNDAGIAEERQRRICSGRRRTEQKSLDEPRAAGSATTDPAQARLDGRRKKSWRGSPAAPLRRRGAGARRGALVIYRRPRPPPVAAAAAAKGGGARSSWTRSSGLSARLAGSPSAALRTRRRRTLRRSDPAEPVRSAVTVRSSGWRAAARHRRRVRRAGARASLQLRAFFEPSLEGLA